MPVAGHELAPVRPDNGERAESVSLRIEHEIGMVERLRNAQEPHRARLSRHKRVRAYRTGAGFSAMLNRRRRSLLDLSLRAGWQSRRIVTIAERTGHLWPRAVVVRPAETGMPFADPSGVTEARERWSRQMSDPRAAAVHSSLFTTRGSPPAGVRKWQSRALSLRHRIQVRTLLITSADLRPLEHPRRRLRLRNFETFPL